MTGTWYCERHPESEMGHNGCTWPGVPEEARNDMFRVQRRNALQELREFKKATAGAIRELLDRIKELEK